MPEIESDKPHGHLKLGTQDLRQNLYRLFCYFYASESLFDCADEDTGANFLQLRGKFEESEIQSALIAVAVRLRIVEKEYRNVWQIEDFGADTGVLQENIKSAKEIPLSLREACNKIVHAEKFQFDRTFLDDESGTLGPLNPWVFIYGEKIYTDKKDKKKKTRIQWRAKLEIKAFVNLGEYVCSGVDFVEIDLATVDTTPKPKPVRAK